MSTIALTYDGTTIPDVMWASASFESQMGGIPGTFEITIKDENRVHSFTTGKHIALTIDGALYYGGIVTQVTRKFAFPVDRTDDLSKVHTRQWVLRGVDYNIWFDKRVLFNVASPISGIPDYTGTPNDKQVITKLCTDYLDLSDTAIAFGSTVDHVDNPYGTDTTSYTYPTPSSVWRDVMKDIVQWTGALYYIDHAQALQYHALETVSPSWGFSDQPNHSTTFGFRELDFTEDGTNLVNDALVWGGSAYTSTGVTAKVNFGRWTNTTSVGARGRWQGGYPHFNENGFASDANCALHAKVIVEGAPGAALAGLEDINRGLVNPQKQLRMTWFSGTTPTPLVAGSVVTTDLNVFGFSVSLPVRSIRISFVTPTEAKFEGFFGIQTDDPWSLWKYMRSIQHTLAAGQATNTTLINPTSDGSAPASIAGTEVYVTPTPAANGTTKDFFVTDIYLAGSTEVWLNGLLQRQGTEYTESDPANKKFTFYDAPVSGDQLWVRYDSAGDVTVAPPVIIIPPPGGYTFFDQFDDLSNWRTQDYIGGGQEATFNSSQSTVAGSTLAIAAVRTAPNVWLSGCITTDPVFQQLYGLFEARIKIPKGKGMWPAFWLIDSPFAQTGELDVMEILANPIGTNGGLDAGYLVSTVHYPPGQSGYGKRETDFSLDYHIYGMDWRATYVAFLLDGVEFARFTDATHIPNFAMPIILNLAVGGSWAGASDGTTPSPSTMLVDWVRASA